MVELIIFVLGLAFGSFVTAFTWRLHEGKDFVAGRSECESCGHTLGALDLIPVLSWVFLRGKCRYCKKAISWANPLLELIMATLFLLSYIFWPYSFDQWQAITLFAMWLVYLVMLISLAVYDLKWMLLPNVIVFPLIVLGLVDVGLRLSLQGDLTASTYAIHAILGACALGGFYWVLYEVSKGKWVGFGDVKLGFFMGIVLGWQQALMVLFIANVIGLIVILPALALGKLGMKSRLPFGPFLIAGFIIVGLFGAKIVEWYMHTLIMG